MSDAPAPLPPEEGQGPAVYASPEKRVMAWVGVVYMLMILALVTFAIYTGRQIAGIAPLMLAPAAGGMGVLVVVRHRAGKGRGGLFYCVLLCTLSAVLCVTGIVQGVIALLPQL